MTYIYTHTERLTGLADTTTTHERLLSQGKHTDISSCIFELSNRHFNTSSIQLILSKSCYSFFCVKSLPSVLPAIMLVYIFIIFCLDSFILFLYSLCNLLGPFLFEVSKLNASPCSGNPTL